MSSQGRKPGQVPQYSEAEFELKKAEAKALYLSGKNPAEIDDTLDLKLGRTSGWASRFGWDDERNKVLGKVSEDRLQMILQQQEGTFRELRLIRDKAIDSIVLDEVVPAKFSESVNAYLNTLDIERKIKSEALQISFITDVAKILKEKIQDRELLFEIAESLKEVVNKYQAKNLSADDKIMSED